MKNKKTNWQKLVFYALLNLCYTSFFAAVVGSCLYWLNQEEILTSAKTKAKREAVRATLKIDRELRVAQEAALAIANEIGSGRLSQPQILEQLESKLEQYPNLLDVGIACEPFACDPNRKLYAPFYARLKGEIKFIANQDTYDYTRPKYIWYRNTLSKGYHWGEPYFWSDTSLHKDPVVGFYTPFYTPEAQTKPAQTKPGQSQKPQGIVYAEYSLKTIRELMQSLNLGKTGYGFILSRSGLLVYHPNEEYVKNQKNFFDLTYEQNDKNMQYLASRALRGEPINADFKDEVTGQKSWLFMRQTNLNGWVAGIIFIQDEVVPDSETTRRQIIALSLAFLCFLSFLSLIVFRIDKVIDTPLASSLLRPEPDKHSVKRLSAASLTLSLLFMTEIGFVWSLALRSRTYTASRNLLLSKTGVRQLLAPQFELSVQLNRELPTLVTTGVSIESLQFASSSDVFITGYVWQKYQDGIHDELSRGFILPDAVSSKITEAYRHKEENLEVIGWYIEAMLRQNFDFSNYPFDHKDVKIRLLHQDFNRQDLGRPVFLVPDLAAYPTINPRSKPGVDEGIVLANWYLNDSFFEYQFKNYQTNFGFNNGGLKTNFPELCFTMVLQRDFISNFIAKVGPLIVVANLLFAILLTLHSSQVMRVVSACGGFVFIVILNQVATREQIITKGIVYFEYFYFIIYFYIFAIAIIALLLLLQPDLAILKYKNNLISKVLYWPSLLNLLMVITILVFL